MNKYSVIVSRNADQMLVRHARFLARVSVPAAQRMAKEFSSLLDALEHNPLQFPLDDAYNLPQGVYRKALFSKWYKALFMIEAERVYLDAVLDCSQDNSGFQAR